MALRIRVLAGQVDRFAGSHVYHREIIRRLAIRGHDLSVLCFNAEPETDRYARVTRIGFSPCRTASFAWRFASIVDYWHASRGLGRGGLDEVDVVFGGEHLFLRPHARLFPATPIVYFPMAPVVTHELENQHGATFQGRVSKAVYRHIQRWALEHTDVTVRFTAITCEELRQVYPGVQPSFVVNPPGVDIPTNDQRESGRGDCRLLSVGRLTPWKGLDVTLETLADLRGLPWRFDVVGDGECRSVLQEQARRLGIADRVHFHGFQHDLEPWYRQADLFLFPSRCESLGLVLMDAMARGVPCLGIKADGGRYLNANQEVIEHQRTGLLAESEREYARLLRHAIEHRTALRALGDRAREKVRQYNSWDAHIQRLEHVFVRVLSDREHVRGGNASSLPRR